MPDLTRGYRFWLVRRLSMLVPACGGAGLFAIHQWNQIMNTDSMLWVHFACLCLAMLLMTFTGLLTFRCIACYRTRQSVGIHLKRRNRKELEQAGLMGMVCLAVLPALSLIPATFQDLSRSFPTHLLEVSRLLDVSPQPAPVREKPKFNPLEGNTSSIRVSVKPAPPVPEISVREITPLPTETFAVETQPAYVYLFQEEEKKADPWTFADPPRLDRLGLPDPLKPFEWMLPEINIELLLLTEMTGTISARNKGRQNLDDDLDMNSAGFRIDFDLPVSRDDSLLIFYQPIGLSAVQNLSEATDGDLDDFLLWQRLGIFYAHRFVGYTSESAIDFAIMCGIVGDSLLTMAQGGGVDEVFRLSPYIGMELGLWQQGPAGLLLNASQTFPLNITGAASRVTEISAKLRIDFTKTLSIHLGYFGIRGRFQDFSGKMTWKGSKEELDVLLHGPTFGFDLRF